jgi:hypothetical protein
MKSGLISTRDQKRRDKLKPACSVQHENSTVRSDGSGTTTRQTRRRGLNFSWRNCGELRSKKLDYCNTLKLLKITLHTAKFGKNDPVSAM